ncbi:MAG: hypothetical protein AB7C92_08330, partial [Synergistaceae bacterium]
LSPYLILKLRLSERRTGETGCSLWQTPSVEDAGRKGSAEAWKQYAQDGRTTQCRLRNQVQMWPTPRAGNPGSRKAGTGGKVLAEEVKKSLMWPTPREFMYKDSTTDRNKGNLGEVVGGQLNPAWVEWLQGFPVGWTDIGE